MRSLLPCLILLPLCLTPTLRASAQPARPAQPSPCQGLADATFASECQKLAGSHRLLPQVVAVCGRLSPAPVALKCLQVVADRQYSADAIDWCSRRPSGEDVVQCFTLTGGNNRPLEPMASSPPAAPPARSSAPAPSPSPQTAATEISRRPLPTAAGPRGPQAPGPEVMQPAGHRPPPSTLDRVGNDIRSVVEPPGNDWLERVGRDVRGGAQTVGGALKPRPQNDPAYGPGSPPPAASQPPATSPPR
ncbi:MAG TPA: hypothetical protein PKI03_04660 [Pseudomonadota bacterium]|nr:hypothetical protein [Pseudomonadota bacterium]